MKFEGVKIQQIQSYFNFFCKLCPQDLTNGILVIYESYDVLGVILVYMENCPTIIKLSGN